MCDAHPALVLSRKSLITSPSALAAEDEKSVQGSKRVSALPSICFAYVSQTSDLSAFSIALVSSMDSICAFLEDGASGTQVLRTYAT